MRESAGAKSENFRRSEGRGFKSTSNEVFGLRSSTLSPDVIKTPEIISKGELLEFDIIFGESFHTMEKD